ncbi:hypothetical protein [Roseomonas haemaphysalidis]|uniref:DUF1652 domain-containing protein n=1 Tax=Roseomonas haemaphysalidis TaxID=2768162 RepID=A0ABS3KW56_9PROT|nr:hypothetical protein [Roseomonas haemaphysalidis]MBO1081715.1 hypothetical protein [Roseomonas haemaphysalidis]
MIPDLVRGPLLDDAQVQAICRKIEAAFLPRRCWVNITESQELDFEVMTLQGDPVVSCSSHPIETIANPADLDSLLFEAKLVAAEHGHAFDRSIQRP